MPPEDVVLLPHAVADVLSAQIARVQAARSAAAAATAEADAAQALLDGLFHGALVALGVDEAIRARAMLLMTGRGYALAPQPESPSPPPESSPSLPASPGGSLNGSTTTPALVSAEASE